MNSQAQSPLPLPATLDEALSCQWLGAALAPLTGGAPIQHVERVEVLRTVATKARFIARWNGGEAALCLKAFLEIEGGVGHSGSTAVAECSYYNEVAAHVDVLAPPLVTAPVDRQANNGVLIMRDVVAAGGKFCSALEPLNADEAAQSLDQLAHLHAGGVLLPRLSWIGSHVEQFAARAIMPAATLQALLDDPRSAGLPPAIVNAERLLAGLSALAAYDAGLPRTLIHGDCHAGNLYRLDGKFGLIDWQLLQKGSWALDVVYHIAAVLPVDVAEREERRLLDDYLARARSYGAPVPQGEEAWLQYRTCAVWGYFLWAITRRVDPPIIHQFVNRLGNAVARLGSFGLLDV